MSSSGFTTKEVIAEAVKKFDHQMKLSAYKNPLLILHTERDGLVDISHAERNYKWSASSQKRLLRFPTGDHNSILERNRVEYFGAVREFVESLI